MALSPDGASIVFYGAGAGGASFGLHLRRLDRLESSPIPGGEGAANPVISPDGRAVFFIRFDGAAYQFPLDGGQPTAVADMSPVVHFAWSDDGTVVFLGADGGIWRMPARGGSAERLASPDTASGERQLQVSDVLPGGRVALVVASAGSGPVGPPYAVDLRSGARRRLLDTEVRGAWYVGHRTLVYTRLDGLLYGIAFDPATLTVTGEPVGLGGPVSAMPIGLSRVSVSRTGAVLYAPVTPADLMLVSREGGARALLERQAEYHNPRLSPDGRRIALDINEPTGRDAWVLALDQGTLTRATFDNDGHDAIWSRDGRSLVYASTRDGVASLLRSRLDGSPGELLARGVTAPGGWTADGTLLGTTSGAGPATGWNLSAVAPNGAVEPFLATRFSEAWPALSPDGAWLAYVSDESRQLEVYVRRVDGEGGRIQVSTDGGTEPVWSRDGRELYYRRSSADDPEMMVARLDLTGPTVLSRHALFGWADFEGSEPHPNYDVAPDGRGFVMIRRVQSGRLILIQNVHRLVHAGRR
ncbi:MAG: hypothetical protein ACREMR_06040 [Gemmatimonadales bacterium]